MRRSPTFMERFDMLDEDGEPYPIEALPGRRALAGEDNAETVVRFRIRDTGEERWSAVKATPIRDHDGNVTMAINVIEDITTHKRAERAQRFLARSGEVLASRSTRTSCSRDRQARRAGARRLVRRRRGHRGRRARAKGARPRGSRRPPAGDRHARRATRPTPTPRRASTRWSAPASRSSTRTSRRDAPRGGRRRGALRRDRRDRDALGDRRADDRPRAHARRAHAVTACRGAGSTSRTSSSPRSSRAACATADRQRAPLQRARLHRAHAAAEPAAGRAARHPGHRDRRPLPPDRRGQRGGRRLLRRVRDRRRRLGGRHGRRVRQGPRRRGRDRAGPLHAPRRRHARAAPEPEPRAAERGPAPAARRPALLHGRLRLPREARPRRPRGLSTRRTPAAAAAARRRRRVEPVGEPGTLLGVVPDPSLEDRTVTLEPGRRAGPLHGRRDREPAGARTACSTSGGSRSWSPPARATARTRSRRGSRTPP